MAIMEFNGIRKNVPAYYMAVLGGFKFTDPNLNLSDDERHQLGLKLADLKIRAYVSNMKPSYRQAEYYKNVILKSELLGIAKVRHRDGTCQHVAIYPKGEINIPKMGILRGFPKSKIMLRIKF